VADSRRAAAEAIRLGGLASVVIPLCAIALVVYQFRIESDAFFRLVLLTIAGFCVHYFLPLRYRLGFFVCLSLVAIGLLLGLHAAAWLIGMSLCLIGVCYLPIPLRLRVGILISIGLTLAVLRTGRLSVPWPTAIWPILGSMFMFRLAAYLYDVRHQPSLSGLGPTLSYFFLLPNVCFPLFPVVDYSTFRRQYYSEERHRIHQVGVQWIFRGVVQLILYRVVYQTLVSDPGQVVTVVDLGRYLLWPFLLYLRVSGQFHIIVGMLRLFGFNLPETHREYFLTSSFTDFWRRINIYWKDFMLKVVYTPAYFSLRRRGETSALVWSTALVFVATWLLHSYQWFWITGSSLFAWNDVLFWSILAICVVVNSVREWKHGRQRRLAPETLTWGSTLRLVARTLAMFVAISVLWSLWSTESVKLWLSLWSAAARGPAAGQGPMLLLILAVPLAIALWVVVKSRGWLRRDVVGSESPYASGALLAVSAVGIVLLGSSAVYSRLGPAAPLIVAVRYAGLNQADAVNLERGYYENLMAGNRFNGELWNLYMNRPPEWTKGVIELGLARPSDELLPYELLPSSSLRFKGAVVRTNAWGMHDKEYARQRPRDCYRIAVLGASHAMGTGVDRDATFEAVLESRLNEGAGKCFEVLNFSVYGYNPIDQIEVLEKRVITFEPNAILYVGHPEDTRRVALYLAQQAIADRLPPYEPLRDIARLAGIDTSTSEREAVQKMSPFGDRILGYVHQRLTSYSRSHGMCAAWVLLPMVPEMPNAPKFQVELETARDAGFIVLDLSDVYVGSDRNSLWIADWDAHPNAQAHRLVGERLYALIKQHRDLLTCGWPAEVQSGQGSVASSP
jgi:D-alanyl-lipoteichoic acid acyltransferase DltB (MBOAT superfamily)